MAMNILITWIDHEDVLSIYKRMGNGEKYNSLKDNIEKIEIEPLKSKIVKIKNGEDKQDHFAGPLISALEQLNNFG